MDNTSIIQPLSRGTSISKQRQTEVYEAMKLRVIEGEVAPMEAYAQVKGLMAALEQFVKDKDVLDSVITAVQQYGKGEDASYLGAKFAVGEVGVKYDYSGCNDPVWCRLANEKAEIEAKMKEREAFLKGIKTRQTIVDEETGEIYEVTGPSRTSTTSVRITFPKKDAEELYHK